MTDIPIKKLNERAKMPILGFGTGMLRGKELQNSLTWAFEAGYRHIDTADYYQNHKDIGKFLDFTGVSRDEVFLTTKVWKTDLAESDVKLVLKKSLDELKTDYVDLFLIHAPSDDVPISETLGAMRELMEDQLINAIGVSNFNKVQVGQVLDVQKHWSTDFKIVNNQIEYNPTHKQNKLRQFCFKNDVTMTAYSPLGKGENLDSETIVDLSKKYDRTPAQIVLKWLVQKGLAVIPSSTKKDHIEDNVQIFDWKLEKEDIQRMDDPAELIGVKK